MNDPTPATPQTPSTRLCANCAAPLLGPYCYRCGQSEKGLVRHLAGVIGDFLDTVFNFDSRTFRTLWPLYFRPGFLTTEYFAGRRVRYVTPFRLYFFFCIVTFLIIQLSLDFVDFSGKIQFDNREDNLSSAATPEEVNRIETATIEKLEQSKSKAKAGMANSALDHAIGVVHKKAAEQLAYLKSVEEAKAKGTAIPVNPNADDEIKFDDKPWDPTTHPLRAEWLPDRLNTKLNAIIGHMLENVKRARQDPKPLVAGIFGVLPQTLFVLMPLFAVLLKIFYLFKRRLYMEHLIVALHSHSFIFLSLLLLTACGFLREWTRTAAPNLVTALDWVMLALSLWLPLYLLIMQKRVYRQNWFMTVFKYCVIGICYTVMIGFGLIAALLVSLATT